MGESCSTISAIRCWIWSRSDKSSSRESPPTTSRNVAWAYRALPSLSTTPRSHWAATRTPETKIPQRTGESIPVVLSKVDRTRRVRKNGTRRVRSTFFCRSPNHSTAKHHTDRGFLPELVQNQFLQLSRAGSRIEAAAGARRAGGPPRPESRRTAGRRPARADGRCLRTWRFCLRSWNGDNHTILVLSISIQTCQ